MKKKHLIYALISFIGMLFVFSGCAVNPVCPNNLLPVIEVQINGTASNHDDYANTASYTVCRARITNVNSVNNTQNFPGGVQVEIRNPSTVPNLTYSTSGSGAGSANLFQTLPGNGSWLTFYIKGLSADVVDKSTIIELATAGATCNEVVLARKALMVTATPPIAAGNPQVEIELGSVSTLDDYITWAPAYCRIRWANGAAASTLNVSIQNMSGTNRLGFANASLAGGQTASNNTLPLALNGNGDWVTFYVAGHYVAGPGGNASIKDKDAVMEVINTATSALLSREGMMVRIRKNADNLTTDERDRYLEALKKVDLTYNDYINFVRTHARDNSGSGGANIAFFQSHATAAFLPWHRAFVLHLERLLQAADPSITIPYWNFQLNSSNIFTPDFMGSNSTDPMNPNMANLSATNPIVSWTLPLESVPTGILRNLPYGNTGHPVSLSEMGTLTLGTTFAAFRGMEVNTHNVAHGNSGFDDPGTGLPTATTSWIGSYPAIATRDPLFFFLHCNVDRLWAKWQWMNSRYDVANTATYNLQGGISSGTAPSPAASAPLHRTLGQYADDTMWPWDNITGGTVGSITERPNISVLTPFPITLSAILPFNKPTVKSVIDYLTITSGSPGSGLGFAYDDFYPY